MQRNDQRALEALQRAIDLCGGSRRELARRICEQGYPRPRGQRAERTPAFSSQRIDHWLNGGAAIAVEAAPFVSAAVGGKVSVYDLCPQFEAGWRLLEGLLRVEEVEAV
jgi:hypothetical protein